MGKRSVTIGTNSGELNTRQRGDFQTPEPLSRQVWSLVNVADYDLIIEPTFGAGSFLTTAPEGGTAAILGWEIHREYYERTLARFAGRSRSRIHLAHGDIFAVTGDDLPLAEDTAALVIGNPPWVTSAEQGRLGGRNTGPKRNMKALAGLDALTGKANFDIAEAIILHLLTVLAECRMVDFVLLTKFTVARNLLRFLGQLPQIGDFSFRRIDAQHHFGAAVEAGVLRFRVGPTPLTRSQCAMYEAIEGPCTRHLRLEDGRFIYDDEVYRRNAFLEAEGSATYVWRQGLKHDLRDVFELSERDDGLYNRRGERVDVEPEVLYRLYKSSDLFTGKRSRFVVPVYQRDLQDNLAQIASRWPKLWAYLEAHAADFRGRKSSIYRKRPLFSLFGIGAYTYQRYKVAVGSLYAEPVFQLLEPAPRLAVIDDTCYSLTTDDRAEAIYLLAILRLACTRDFLLAISAAGDKRRFPKDVLSRLHLPPYASCPVALTMALVEEWDTGRRFVERTQQELTAWLRYQRELRVPSALTAAQPALF
jgi:hypothetical protein